MISKILIAEIFLFFFRVPTITAQFENDSIIYWVKSRPLKWSDFQGVVPVNYGKDKARSFIAIQTTFVNKGHLIDVKVSCSFNKMNSWKSDTILSILQHEQLHFDIAELYARRIRKAVLDLKNANQTYIEEYRKSIRVLLKEYNCVDEEYDKETAHSINKLQQVAWEKKINEELKEFKDYYVDY